MIMFAVPSGSIEEGGLEEGTDLEPPKMPWPSTFTTAREGNGFRRNGRSNHHGRYEGKGREEYKWRETEAGMGQAPGVLAAMKEAQTDGRWHLNPEFPMSGDGG